MSHTSSPSLEDAAPSSGRSEGPVLDAPHSSQSQRSSCFHCGSPCPEVPYSAHQHSFCCHGCLTVYDLLLSTGLTDFYQLSQAAGVRVKVEPGLNQYLYLDEPGVRSRIVDFSDSKITRVTFRIPAMHCVACVWLLEKLFQMRAGIGRSTVNFPRKELSLSFDPNQVRLSEVVGLLASLGYEPDLALADLDARPQPRIPKRLWLQLGIAGFAFGNNMLFSIASYLGLDHFSGPAFKTLTGYISLVLALPVVIYSAADYWRSAWISLKHRLLNIDVPIAAGLAALFLQSVYEVVSTRGDGYFDSLAGLLFFLLWGKVFQRKTYDRLTFDRDYKSFFPLSARRIKERKEESVSLSQIEVGDRILIRNGELIPADGRLLSGRAVVDYSFVTGEAEPSEKAVGEILHAGGRQIGGIIELETTKRVSESYLTSLWNQEAFRKSSTESLDELTNQYSQRFTRIIVVIAFGAALYWAPQDPSMALKAFTSVLIVACPCALALAAPFTLGTAQRVLSRNRVFLRNTRVIEALARINAVVFDKTGTLTAAGAGAVTFHGLPLTENEERWLYSMTRHSTHPYAVRVGHAIEGHHYPETVRSFLETPGCGMEGTVANQEVWMGSAAWLESRNVTISAHPHSTGGFVHVAINGSYRGCYALENALRPNTARLIRDLSARYNVSLLSGDNERELPRFREVFGDGAQLLFNQSPLDKLNFVRSLQGRHHSVLMVGDGLNDAGALKQSDVGAAVVENVSAFSPACDVILAANMVPRIQSVLAFSRTALGLVRASFLISTLYNVVGITIAAKGLLSPIVCAILMPLSSISVIAFSCLATWWAGRNLDTQITPTLPLMGSNLVQPQEATS